MFLTYEEFCKRIDILNSDYWNQSKEARWGYMSYVIDLLKNMALTHVVEAGAHDIPLSDSSFLLNYPEYDLNILDDYTFPYRFDVFVALQVWEHLENPIGAFSAIKNIADRAILSFPYNWPDSENIQHRNIGDETILLWIGNLEPSHTKIIEEIPGRERERFVCGISN